MMNIHGTSRRLIAVLVGAVSLAMAALVLTGVFGLSGDSSSAAQSTTTTTSSLAESRPALDVLLSGDVILGGEVPESISLALSLIPATEDGRGIGVVEGLGVVPGGTSRSEVVVAEVSKKICVFAGGTDYQGAADGSCFSAAEVEAGTAFVAIQGMAGGVARVIGLAPDGVAHVSFDTEADGRPDAVASVSANVYQADLATVPTVASGLDSEGRVEFVTKMPLSVGAVIN